MNKTLNQVQGDKMQVQNDTAQLNKAKQKPTPQKSKALVPQKLLTDSNTA